jgi:hypothetical protein
MIYDKDYCYDLMFESPQMTGGCNGIRISTSYLRDPDDGSLGPALVLELLLSHAETSNSNRMQLCSPRASLAILPVAPPLPSPPSPPLLTVEQVKTTSLGRKELRNKVSLLSFKQI